LHYVGALFRLLCWIIGENSLSLLSSRALPLWAWFSPGGSDLTPSPPSGDFPLAPCESGFFLFPLSWSSRVSLLPTSRVVELLFPQVRSGGGWPSPILFGLWWLVICFSLLFLSFWQDCSSQDVFYGGVADPTCCRRDDFWQVFSHFFRWFWKPDLHFSAKFWLTRASQPRSPPSFAPVPASSSRVDRRWSARGAHAPRSSLLLGTHEGHAPSFSGRERWQPVLRHRIRATVWRLWPPSPLPTACFWVFLLFCVCVIILFFSGHSLLVFGSNFVGIFVG
jgi:hypothetical protein